MVKNTGCAYAKAENAVDRIIQWFLDFAEELKVLKLPAKDRKATLLHPKHNWFPEAWP